MAVILGLKRVLANLEKRAVEATPAQVSVFVGFTQTYALHVHEVKRPHKEPTQWKYLETPAREKQNEIAEEIRNAYITQPTSPKRLEKALLVGAMRLQAEAQLITPVQTGALKGSAFTAVERELEQKFSSAFERSQAIKGAG